MMKLWLAVGVVVSLVALEPITADAQYCIGYTKYGVRGPDGKVLTDKERPKLRFVSFDGKKRKAVKRTKSDVEDVDYTIDGTVRRHHIASTGGVHVVFGPCGQIDELVLRYRGKTMVLLFGVDINNTNYEIDSLPFQAGRFRLTSLRCADGKAAPMVDNENHGHCSIPASAWKKVEKKPKRPVKPAR